MATANDALLLFPMCEYKASAAIHFVTGIMFALGTAIDHVLRSVKPRESNVHLDRSGRIRHLHARTLPPALHSTYANTVQQAHRRRRNHYRDCSSSVVCRRVRPPCLFCPLVL
jgi:hypothetical protein